MPPGRGKRSTKETTDAAAVVVTPPPAHPSASREVVQNLSPTNRLEEKIELQDLNTRLVEEAHHSHANADLCPLTPELIEALWVATVAYGTAIWEKCLAEGKQADGLAAWQPIKTAAARSTGTSVWCASFVVALGAEGRVGPRPLAWLEAREADAQRIADAAKRGEVTPQAVAAARRRGEDAHYFAQLLRIPLREECSVRRLMQVAFNAGQLVGSGALGRLAAQSEHWANLYTDEGLGRPETYCVDVAAFRVPTDLLAFILALASK